MMLGQRYFLRKVRLVRFFCRSVFLIERTGRLYQVEYAMEAISHAGTTIGILASDGVVLAAEKKVTSKLLEPSRTSEKIYKLNK